MNSGRSLLVLALLFVIAGCGSKSNVVTTKKEQNKLQKDTKIVYVDKNATPETEPEPQLEEVQPEIEAASDIPASTVSTAAYPAKIATYIERYREIAKYEMKEHGIPASITLAQGILESAAGTSELAVRANNHFGIKCNDEWKGEKAYRQGECYRNYENVRRSFTDHSLFLQRPYYRALFSLQKTDYKSWARGLKDAGYATDKKYPEKLIDIIERYHLYYYDREVMAASQHISSTDNNNANNTISSPAKTTTTNSNTIVAYIDRYKEMAKYGMKEHGIPVSIILAQAILESGAGTSELAVRANNHFGISCSDDWTGEKAYRQGKCFRSYENVRKSFTDHSLFLQRPNYRALFSLDKTDYKSWARGLKDAGYATDSNYPQKLISIIERYQLQQYDWEVLAENAAETSETTVPAEASTGETPVKIVAAPPGETAAETTVETPVASTDPVVNYIDTHKEIAKYEMKEHGIPASITLAQAILESGAGASEVAIRAKNHFGLKCNNDWQGATFYRDDQCFRKYDDVRRSYRDHSLFLKRPNYRALASLEKNDYKSWARELQKGGYAMDVNYPQKLIDIIERYQLYKYDREVLASTPETTTEVVAQPPAQPGTTLSADLVVKYIDTYREVAKNEMKENGIPASITLAQAILESGAGASEVAVRAKNHFGLKCANNWRGDSFNRDGECFRKYENVRLSYADHSRFLQQSRYRALAALEKNDYKSWARELQYAGYATDSQYAQKLIDIIDRYQLYKYDREVLADTSAGTTTTETPAETPSTPSADPVMRYIESYKDVAKYEMKEYGVPASITLAQAILESGAGASEVAVRAKNHFGLKCNEEWRGDTFYRDSECYRKYENAGRSYKDHSLFLKRPHYSKLFELDKTDYVSWAKGLKEAGYAKDRNYPEKLINIIERYQLQKYDREVVGAMPNDETAATTTPSTPSGTEERYVVQRGDTLYSISRKYGISVNALMQMNGLKDNNIATGQVLTIKK